MLFLMHPTKSLHNYIIPFEDSNWLSLSTSIYSVYCDLSIGNPVLRELSQTGKTRVSFSDSNIIYFSFSLFSVLRHSSLTLKSFLMISRFAAI